MLPDLYTSILPVIRIWYQQSEKEVGMKEPRIGNKTIIEAVV